MFVYILTGVRVRLQVWCFFNEVICPATSSPTGLKCAIEGCGAMLASTTNTTNARQHLSHVHKDHLAELEAEEYANEIGDGVDAAATSTVYPVQSVISRGCASWPAGKRDTLTKKVVEWLCKRARPLSMPERDTELNDVLIFASDGGYSMPSAHNVVRHLCALSGKALANDRQKVSKLRSRGVDPSAGTLLF